MNVLILGAGAVGGYFGGRLIESGADVTFLVRPQRAHQLQTSGLIIQSPAGDARLTVATITRADPPRRFDLIIIACKAYDLDSAIEATKPHLDTGAGTVLPLLNGLAHVDRLRRVVGPDRTIGGWCGIFATLGANGEVRHLDTFARLAMGRFQDQIGRGVLEPEAAAIEKVLEGSNFTFRRQEPIEQGMWEKWVMLAPMAAGTTLLRGSIGDILLTREGRSILLGLLGEAAAIATAAGFPPSAAHLDIARSVLTTSGSSAKASLLRDVERGGPNEGAHIIGDLLDRAVALNVETPLLRIANAHLETHEAARRAAR